MPDTSILEEALRITRGKRNEDYGPPDKDYEKVVGAFNKLTGHDLTASEGIVFMCCVKLSRICHKYSRDSVVDLAGYADCLARAQPELVGEITKAFNEQE